MQNNNQFLKLVLAAVIGAALVLLVNRAFPDAQEYSSIEERQNLKLVDFKNSPEIKVPAGLNFVTAASKTTAGVVHIRSKVTTGNSNSPFNGMFNNGSPYAQSSGSGVIVSDDGYIVTNNHVVDNASEIEVVLNNNQEYEAQVIGVDTQTDLALIKIKGKNLPFVPYGNSETVAIGEWVLAVGNPFNLTSTVTAGIVSAKARNIGILADKNNLQIESFIQTDAAVNPGNSGGALVNLNGELIGINTAIATQSGRYEGYSFAVPVSLVKKVVDDLMNFGEVQRGLLGVRIGDMSARIAEMEGIGVVSGVYIGGVNSGSAAEEAGIEVGDVIVGIDGKSINNVAELQEMVALKRPGDAVEVEVIRDNEKQLFSAVLKKSENSLALNETVRSVYSVEGATFENTTEQDQRDYKISGGVKITSIQEGKWKDAGITNGFVITQIEEYKVNDVEDLRAVLSTVNGGILVKGVSDQGEEQFFGLKW